MHAVFGQGFQNTTLLKH